jgi:hypothetical protein
MSLLLIVSSKYDFWHIPKVPINMKTFAFKCLLKAKKAAIAAFVEVYRISKPRNTIGVHG